MSGPFSPRRLLRYLSGNVFILLFMATAPPTVEAAVAGVQLLVDGKQTDVIVPKNRRALLEAIVSPPEAQQTAIFFWYINGNLQQHLVNQQFHLEFSKTGEVKLEVAAQNDVSYAVMSPEVRVLVVERLGDVRGLADHHSVLVRNARIYTVLVGRGSNITYTWDFGDHQSPFNTTVPTTKHTYLTAGTYTLTVTLTTPLGDLHVTTSKVFVLRSGECDTPKVLGLYPKKIYNRREFDGTQEILVEPELLRNCPTGTGPEYHWTIWNQNGQKVLFTNTRLDAPSLLIHPVYDHPWPSWTHSETCRKVFGMVLRVPNGEQAVAMGALVPHTLKAGEYLTQLTVKERDTIVEASVNTSFSVVSSRLRVTFVDGTEREVDRGSNVTLRVEVVSPTPNYTLSWDCFPLGYPDATCFQQPGILNTFPTTTNVGENFFSRFQHLWKLFHNTSSSKSHNNNMNNPQNGNHYAFSHSSPSPPPMEEDDDFLSHAFNNSYSYIVSLTFPASILLTDYSRFHFSVSVTRYHQLHPVNASQLVVVNSSRDNIGIQTYLGSQLPFGAQRRMVFESECMSCSPEEVKALQYTWTLKMIANKQTIAEQNFAKQQKVPDEKEVLRALGRVKVKEGSFLPRPRDYLRIYNISLLREALSLAAPEEDIDTAPFPPTPSLSPRDLQNMPKVVTPEIIAQAAQHRRGGLRLPSQDARGILHKPPTTRTKRDLEQSDPALILKVKKSRPPRPLGNSVVMDDLPSNAEEGREALVSATAPAAAHHAQRRRMREDDRTSSSQTNMRRKVVGRHSGEAAQGPVTDEAALPTLGSPTTPALVKVTIGSHHSHLAHRTAHNPRQRAKDKEGGNPAAHPPASRDPPPRLSERNTIPVETEHQTEPTEIPDHRRITKRNSRAEKMIEAYEMAFEAPQSASAQGVDHSRSRNTEVKWEAMGKVVDVEEATQQHQVIPSKGKVQEKEYLKIEEEEEEKEKEVKEKEDEKRLWEANDGAHTLPDHPLSSGSGKGEEQRPVTEAAPRTGGVSTYAPKGLMKDERLSTITLLPDTPAIGHKASTAREKVTEATPPVSGITRESTLLHHAISTADDATLKLAVRTLDPLTEAEESPGWHEAERQPGQHPHNPEVLRSSLPPLLSPRSSLISVTSRPDNKEGDQFSSDTNHAVRRSEGPETTVLPQQLRRSRVKGRGGPPHTKMAEGLRDQADLQRSLGKIKKQRKKEKVKSMKTERRKEGSNKGRQEVRGRDGGDATPRHPWEQEVGYKENYLTSGVSVKVAEDDANDAQEAQHDVGGAGEARQVARTSRLLTHQHGDSAYTPVSPTPRTLSERGGAAAVNPEAPAGEGLPWYELESKPSALRGVGGKVRDSEPRHYPSGATRPSQTHSRPGMFSSPAPLDFQTIPTVPSHSPKSASTPWGLDYHEYMKLKMAELGHRKIDSHATFGPDRSTGNPARKPDGQGREGESAPRGLHPRLADGKAPNHTTEDGMDQAASASQRHRARLGPTDHLEEERHDAHSLATPTSHSPFSSSSNSPPGIPWYKMQGNQAWNAREAASGDGSGSIGRGQNEMNPPGVNPQPPPPREGRGRASRGPGYAEDMADFVRKTGRLPDQSCRREHWDECDDATSEARRVNETIGNTIGDPKEDSMIFIQPRDNDEIDFVTDESQINVVLFGQLTSTGTHNPVLVLYMDLLSTNQKYILYLNTYNTITNNTGLAKQLIEFSPAPKLENCQVIPLSKTNRSYFRASCSDVEGHFYPVMLQWSYHFLWLGAKTVFYYGARTSFDFTLPPGLEAYDYKVYISVKAIDGKGVSFRYSDIPPVKVEPRSSSGDGVLSIFQEIPTIENESPPLLLQQVRSLAWELNILESSAITQTVVDNILTILFYSTSCKDMLEAPTGSSVPSHTSSDYFVKINFLKSCARDHLAKKVVINPMRDELEVIQALTALQIIIDANENISSTTYLRVLSAMNIAAERMWFSYFAQVRTEAAEEYFILSSAMLDKQTEIYDWNSISIALTTNIITQLLDIMEIETSARFREEKPLFWYTDTLTFYGYWAESSNMNKWNNTVPFLFASDSVFFGVTLVQALVHTVSPFNLPVDPITSEVVYLAIYMPSYINRKVEVTLRHSVKRAGPDYDFRRDGVLTPESLSVYEFEVQHEQQPLVFNVLLEVTQVLNSQYPVAAVVLICQDLQSLYEPLFKQVLTATAEPSDVLLSVPTRGLPTGKMLLIIIDKNSYDNNWGRYNTSSAVIGADFKVSAWWSRCMVWNDSMWDDEPCSVVSRSTSWDKTVCSCDSKHSVYGAQTIPVLDEESKIDVNELMLHETYIALYFIILLLVFYFILALAVQTSDRHRLRRRNIWLRDNKLEHEWAYLLTIKTGTQWNAGTTSKVYAILHGTHGMSETRELQSKQTGQLFTRGALCTFILTTPEPLGDILKVQVWHDNSGGSESGWFVCETSVADLVLGAIYIYPCYRWLSVQAEDAKIEREITLESPTTFLQDFEHFLPQYASEHMLWTSLLTTSNTAKLYRLQRLTICLIVCLCMGTVSLWVVKIINNKHTMMVPDMHIEPLYYGVVIAMVLLPVQWVLEMIFKMSNKLEEKEYNAKAVLDTLRVTKSDTSASTNDVKPSNITPDNENNVYDPEAEIWKNLRNWGLSTELSQTGTQMLHPTLLQDLETDNIEIIQRLRSSTRNVSRRFQSDDELTAIQSESTQPDASIEAGPEAVGSSDESDKICSTSFWGALPKLLKPIGLQCLSTNNAKNKPSVQEENWEAGEDEDYEDDEDSENDLRVSSSITFIFSQCVGWIMCCIFVALCCIVLYIYGSGMPMDYSALWIHIIYVTLCCSIFVMQPLVVVIYTFYKVCVYRWLGCRGCISSCITVPLDQVVDIWNRYQTALRRQTLTTPDNDTEKLLEERQRTRELRSAHPPSEDYLLKCRDKEIRREKVHSLFRNAIGHLALLMVLIILVNNVNIYKRFSLNEAILSSLKNGSCLDTARYKDPCTLAKGDNCNQKPNENYMTFEDIKTKDDWWQWAYTELLALTYSNHDESFSDYNIFCDTNSIIIGQPRLRKYDSSSQECEASKIKIDSNRSMADLLKIGNCFPDYEDQGPHLFSFGSTMDKEYEWDAHFLAVTYGQYSKYSYTSYKQDLPSSKYSANLMFYILQTHNWMNNNGTRAVVTEFTLYHPQTNLYTTLNLLAEFPSLSGAEMTIFVSSSPIERYERRWAVLYMLNEALLLGIAMYYLKQIAVYIYYCRFRIWKSYWGMLDVLMTVFSWSYIVCLMLRVQIAEDAMWQLRVAYFQKFVNLKGLTTWDGVLETLIGCMLTVHLLRCLSLMKYLPRSYRLGLVLASAWKDVKIISRYLLVFLIALMYLGHTWFNTRLWEFHSHPETVFTLLKMVMLKLPFLRVIEEKATGSMSVLGYLYYLLTYVFLYQLMRALYVAAFLNARSTFVDKPGVDVKWKDITFYIKEHYQSLLGKICQERKEEESQPADNTPPDFYMAELELQINQVMSGLESLAESLGVVVDRMNRLEDTQLCYSDTNYSEEHLWRDNDCLYSNDGTWQEEDIESRTSTSLDEKETTWSSMQQQQQSSVGVLDCSLKTNCTQGARPRYVNEAVNERKMSINKDINLDAFTDIESCQAEIEALTQKWNSASGDPSFELLDDGGTLEKFLKDVSESFDNITSFGKYGKTQLRVNTRIHPSHESLNLSQNNSGVTENATHQKGIQSDSADGSVPRGISSRLCKTQTQGRGKGQVDALDISILESDHEDESNC